MCGIVGAVSQREVLPILLEGLHRLEYRGYDSAGVAVVDSGGELHRARSVGKVRELLTALELQPVSGKTGIAHTRWATHGPPCKRNAHPHLSGDNIAVVHNGIIENHEVLKARLSRSGYSFASDTDTEVVAHLVHNELKQHDGLLSAVRSALSQISGSCALVVMDRTDPDKLVVARLGSPLVIGLGIGENFVASDQLALSPVTCRFIFLEEGDVAIISRECVTIFDASGSEVNRDIVESQTVQAAGEKGSYRHFMQKEIFEQADAITHTLEAHLNDSGLSLNLETESTQRIFEKTASVQIVACGTSYHAGLVASYWFEELAGIPCRVEIASEFRYRKVTVGDNTLFVTLSQSGETADTLAALKQAHSMGYLATLCICNVPGSSMVRESDCAVLTHAGAEIGVASTKAFTTQLTALLMLVVTLGRRSAITTEQESELTDLLRDLPRRVQQVLQSSEVIEAVAEHFSDKHHSLFLGRGSLYPIAMEGALKLKEISYIHAEAYAAGELKHGPLALIDDNMPVVVVAPNNELLEKLKSNMEEVRARGGQLFVFTDPHTQLEASDGVTVLPVVSASGVLAPILYTIPLQLLSYYVAVIRGTDVDQPRNLAKSVTVE